MKKFDCVLIGDIMFDVIIPNHKVRMGDVSYSNMSVHYSGIANIASVLSHLGCSVKVIGKSGKDLIAALYKKDLGLNKIKYKIFEDEKNSTGIALSFLSKKGERSILVSRGANDNLFPREIESCSNIIKNSKYLFLSGYSVLNRPQSDAIFTAAKIATQKGVKVFFDPGSVYLIKTKRKLVLKLLNLCDVLCCNLDEAKAISKSNDMEQVSKFFSKKKLLTVITMGSKGCLFLTNKSKLHSNGFKVKALDTTGAGDNFDACLIYGLLQDWDLNKIGTFANWYAGQKVKHFGPRLLIPHSEIASFVKSCKKLDKTKMEYNLKDF